MKQFTFLMSALVIVLFTACITTGGGNNTDNKDKPNKDEPKEENTNEDKGNEGMKTYEVDSKGIAIASQKISLRVKSVQDSRCPKGTNCFVAGEAVVAMEISGKGKVTEEKLIAKGLCDGDRGNCGNSVRFEGITIQLLNVYPSPAGDAAQIPLEKYIVKVRL